MTDTAVADAHRPAPARFLAPGYEIVEFLARGRCLDVYTVWSSERECLCVAKTLRPDRESDHAARARLLHEAELLQRLCHPHLVRGYESIERPWPAAVMETLTGQTLGHLLDHRRRGLAVDDLVELGLQLCSVLGYLHRQGIVHLDLKPSNITADGGRAVLLDLSHARPPGVVCPAGFGTREYMPPEQLIGGTVDAASDSYGLGGVLYRAATRHRPFPSGQRDPRRGPSFARLHRRALPRPLLDLITACLEPDPARRPDLDRARHLLRQCRRTDPQEASPDAHP